MGVWVLALGMLPVVDEFEFEYDGSDLVFGRGCVERLGRHLDEYGYGRALVVTGTNVGSNPDVMDPVSAGLGDRLVGVFDETTPEKLAATAFEGIDVMARENPDVLVGVGGGSSLDIARQMSVFAADGRSLDYFEEAARAGRSVTPEPSGTLTPVVVIPTTFAGADVSGGGSIEVLGPDESPTGQPVRMSGWIQPDAMVYDPALFETTPMGALAGSAMNGFNKGIETPYSRSASPITHATAVRGLQYLREGLPNLQGDAGAMERAIIGIILVQFRRQTSIIHAYGHGFSRRYDLQQGVAHAVMAPHVLRYLFEHVDASRGVLADGLGVETSGVSSDVLAEEIVSTVESVRDALDLPAQLRDIDVVDRGDFPAIAEFILDDPAMDRAPEGLDPTVDELEAVLHAGW